MKLLALDIGATSTRAALLEGGALVWRAQAPTPRGPQAVVELAGELLGAAPAAGSALGVAMTGRVRAGRVTAMNTETLPGWQDFDLASALHAHTGLPTAVVNDARAAAWGEYASGAGQGTSEFAFVTVSTGVGAGFVLGGRLHLAANGLDAEVGFALAPPLLRRLYRLPQLGELSDLEREASGTALGGPLARALCDRAEAGEAAAEAIYGRSAALVAARLADFAVMLGIERVALGGSVGLRPGYLERVRAALAALPEMYRLEVVHAELGADAGLVGAGLWAQQHLGEKLSHAAS
ncbi:N-acylmannosamine kinase [Deinobacterium chartae]|uniref:N-acylmannosamine kinase n=1 Tax=Deinobacterium chartae TaxID=521158 RepID=A0A841I098_9DEIO|nr:ROK family protein [Deinobacterium chartae]MBB6097870.1 N-acylmannosamine kinase [Deinobacterium chartae]